MNEGMKAELLIPWPDGRTQERLDPKVAGLVWQHANRGHSLFHRECYACVCEEAY
jgi:hypothetical protein